MKSVHLALSILLSLMVTDASIAFADCVHPKAPAATPNGTAASQSDMDEAKAALDRYQKAAKEYLKCAETEANAKIAKLGSNVDAIRQLKTLESKRTKQIEDDLQTRADELNDQLRAFKLVNRE